MTAPRTESQYQASLRLQAQIRLAEKNDATAKVPPSAAFRVLYELALSPETAPDALALLHELQVQQVELDLQAEELRGSRADLEVALARQNQLIDHAPTSNFVLDNECRIVELNMTASRRLGMHRDALKGQKLDSYLTQKSIATLHAMFARLGPGNLPESRELELRTHDAVMQTVCASVSTDPGGSGYLVAFSDMPAH